MAKKKEKTNNANDHDIESSYQVVRKLLVSIIESDTADNKEKIDAADRLLDLEDRLNEDL